ncbi:MAG: 4a-hydroxytetrahydrobiopterin dehydratase [Acidimicrobiia bacterium]
MALLTEIQRQAFAASYPEWDLGEASITRTFQFPDFVAAMGFVSQVALLSERAFHHPDIDVRWNKVTLTLSTHSEGGLTTRDVDLAASIDVRA